MKKIAITFIGYFFIEIFFSMIILIALGSIFSPNIQDIMFLPSEIHAGIVFIAAQLIIILFFFLVFIKTFFDISLFNGILKIKPVGFLIGLLLGSALLMLLSVLLILSDVQSYQINSINLTYLIKGLLLTFLIGTKEEVIFRGFLLITLEKQFGKIKSLIISSILFGLIHAFAEDFNFYSFIQICIAGIILCLAFYKTNNLWFPIGIHTGWNYFLLFIYSAKDKNITEPFITGKAQTSPSIISIFEITFLGGLLLLMYGINYYTNNSKINT